MLFRLILIIAFLKAIASKTTHGFQATFKSHSGSKVEFFIDFDISDMLISENDLKCEASNKCNFIGQAGQAQYNHTIFNYQEAEVELSFGNGGSTVFRALITNLKNSVLGLTPGAKWVAAIKGQPLRIQLYTGETSLAQQMPARLTPLSVNEQGSRFYLQSKLVSTMRRSRRDIMRSNAHLKLQFPTAKDHYNGDFYFLIQHRDLEGWDEFLRNVLDEFNQYEVKYALLFPGFELKFDNGVFPAYDMKPFKLAPRDDFIEDFTIGRYFVAQSDMVLYVMSALGKVTAAVEMSQNGYAYGFTLNPVTLIQFLVFSSFAVCSIMMIIWCIPSSWKRKADDDYAVI